MVEATLTEPYDIVIIGAGPAGSSAAQAAARRGAKVLLIDRRQRIGIPVQCAEFVPQWVCRHASFSSTCIIQKIEKMITHLSGRIHEIKSPGYMLDRSLFDKELAASAVLSGAKISIGTKAIGFSPEGLIVEHGSKKETIQAKVFIGADGAPSTIARVIGKDPLKTIAALQYEVVLSEPQNHVDVYFRKDYEGGYGWFFPKEKTANVGIGVVSSKASRLPGLLGNFLDFLRGSNKLQEIQIVSKTGGLIPCQVYEKNLFKSVLLIGDAAGHAHPITGAGILNAVIAGELAGRVAAEAIVKEDLGVLSNYDREWQETVGKSLSYGASKREFLDKNWNKSEVDFEELIRKTWVGFKEYHADRRKTPSAPLSNKEGPREIEKRKPMEQKVSPKFIQTSLAASLTLGFQNGSFHRDAKLKGLNLLLHYDEGCLGKCHFCGLSKSRQEGPKGRTFIRVAWPLYPLEEIIERTKGKDQIHRVCISMITHPKAIEDTIYVIERLRGETNLFISVLISPTLIRHKDSLVAMKKVGADRVGIAIDAASPQLFDQLRGKGVGGPHQWNHYWDVTRMAVSVFGRFYVGIHLIVGLGETEKEMVDAIQQGQNMGAYTHLFSFYPEKGSPMERHSSPPLGQYRRIQLARWIINESLGSAGQLKFDGNGKLIDFGMDIEPLVQTGEPFMTSGCPGRDGKVACNRPYGNERPSGPIRNFPFQPEAEDIQEIRKQLK